METIQTNGKGKDLLELDSLIAELDDIRPLVLKMMRQRAYPISINEAEYHAAYLLTGLVSAPVGSELEQYLHSMR